MFMRVTLTATRIHILSCRYSLKDKILQDQITIGFTKTAGSAKEACHHFHNRMALQSTDQPTDEAHNNKLVIFKV
jgi:hypothetical protein